VLIMNLLFVAGTLAMPRKKAKIEMVNLIYKICRFALKEMTVSVR